MPATKQSATHRSFWALVDQAVASAGNFLLTSTVAHSGSAGEFGAFSLAFAIYLLALGLTRSVASVPLLITHDQTNNGVSGQWASTMTLVVGVAAGLLTAGSSLFFSASVSSSLLAMSVVLPGLLIFDTARYREMTLGAFHRVAFADFLWTAVQALATFAAWKIHWLSAPVAILIWGIAGSVSSFVLAWAPNTRETARLTSVVRTNRQMFLDLLGEFVVTTGVTQSVPFIITLFSGLGIVGLFRACQLLLGPANIVIMGLGSLALLESKKLLSRRPQIFAPFMIFWAVIASGAVFLSGGIFLFLPSLGELLLGARWVDSRTILPLLMLGTALLGPIVSMQTGLRALALTRRAFVIRVLMSVPIVAGVTWGAILGTAHSCALGYATGMALGCVIAIAGVVVPFTSLHREPNGISARAS